MGSSDPTRLREVFLGACSLDSEKRTEFLDRACAGDDDLRASVEALLAHDGAKLSTVGSSRFVPGVVLAGRYRIVSLLGRGGMGEVYRADDLRLGQPVALKFLPQGFERDPGLLSRLHSEVKLARQVTHPNVCRIYDIGEIDGQSFISMEYVSGEDLGSLLRRIGRLPEDKAIQIAREFCAGLAAAHAEGILHRDLKPNNVMVDGRGRAKITDFGLAQFGGATEGVAARSGTPAYMAPEQLARGEVTTQSDLYSLGLLLHELFTGKRVFDGRTPEEVAEQHAVLTPTSLTELVQGLDPSVERVVLQCLETDPGARPPSALAIAAALPGGDLLAAAVAAGETPSPEIVAAVRETDAPRLAWMWVGLLVVLATLTGFLVLNRPVGLSTWAPESPAYLQERARTFIRSLGYGEPPGDPEYGFQMNADYCRHVTEQGAALPLSEALSREQPSAVHFWYSLAPGSPGSSGNQVYSEAPSSSTVREISLLLDPRGRLIEFEAIPLEFDRAGEAVPAPDWTPLFAAAGLDLAQFASAEPARVPPVYADRRAAWQGEYPAAPEIPIRVEAATLGGRLVSFRVLEPWTKRFESKPFVVPRTRRIFVESLLILALIGGVLLARWNLRRGRTDRKSALRLGVAVLVVILLSWLVGARHVPEISELEEFFEILARACMYCLIFWVFYLALEPHLRRFWPRMFVSWIRLFHGRVRDPLVGRDLLIGVVLGCLTYWMRWLSAALREYVGVGVEYPFWMPIDSFLPSLMGVRESLSAVLFCSSLSVYFILALAVVLLLLRLVLRSRWLAYGGLVVLATLWESPSAWDYPWVALIAAVFLTITLRFGILASATGYFVALLLYWLLEHAALSSWTAGSFLALASVVAGLSFYGFWAALAGRSPFGERFLS